MDVSNKNLINFNTPVKLVGSLDFINIYEDMQKRLLVADWIGNLDSNNIRTGFEFIYNNLLFKNYTQILNNNQNLSAHYLGAIDWLVRVYFPLLSQAGIKNMAWVYSPDRYTKVSSEVLLRLCNQVNVKTFNSLEAAHNWLFNIKEIID